MSYNIKDVFSMQCRLYFVVKHKILILSISSIVKTGSPFVLF